MQIKHSSYAGCANNVGYGILWTLIALVGLCGCATMGGRIDVESARQTQAESIRNEVPGNYYIGRRYYKVDYKFWGYVRRPGQPWSTAKLVMLNEQKRLAPDREGGTLGSDNGYEYKLTGAFSGETVYEPASDGFYPEFVLGGYEVRSTDPEPIFSSPMAALDPARRVIMQPF